MAVKTYYSPPRRAKEVRIYVAWQNDIGVFRRLRDSGRRIILCAVACQIARRCVVCDYFFWDLLLRDTAH